MPATSTTCIRAMGYRLRQEDNPHNRFESLEVEYDEGLERPQSLRLFRETGKSFLTRNDSPDLPFRWSANPYRGCAHACAYCYARPYHEFLGLGAGTDFDTQIIAKTNAPELLRKELGKTSWSGEPIAFSGISDCYQPAESGLKLTRECLKVCAEFGNAAGVITKSTLVVRDLDIFTDVHRAAGCNVVLSIPIWDEDMAKKIEAFVPAPELRFRALEKLSAAGIRTGISLGPIIPGLNDSDIPRLLERAAQAGAHFAFYVILRLPGAVETVFLDRLRQAFPERAGKVEHHIRELRGGELYDSAFGDRMRGTGPMAKMIEDLFRLHCQKNGLAVGERRMELPTRHPNESRSPTKAKTSVRNGDSPIQQNLFA
jgi:DNA repair photolyase